MISLDSLHVTQGDIRYRDQIEKMAAFVCRGGFWTRETLEIYAKRHDLPRVSPLIQVSEFEDGQRYIHDGHHRVLSTFLGCRNYLRDDEYVLSKWSYDLYLEFNPANGWFTPFDPRIHVRAADFGRFKKEARRLYEGIAAGVTSMQDLVQYVEGDGQSLYRSIRGNLRSFSDLAEATKFKQLENCNVD